LVLLLKSKILLVLQIVAGKKQNYFSIPFPSIEHDYNLCHEINFRSMFDLFWFDWSFWLKFSIETLYTFCRE
jgi:hypothetical protein